MRETDQASARRDKPVADDAQVDHVLRQWGLYAHIDADVGPEQQTQCGSVEGVYSAPAWDSADMPLPNLPTPDVDVAEAMDATWCNLPYRLHKLVLRTHYVDLFLVPVRYTEDKLIVFGARKLSIAPREYHHLLLEARDMLRSELRQRGVI